MRAVPLGGRMIVGEGAIVIEHSHYLGGAISGWTGRVLQLQREVGCISR
jgi:hypothetical protein